MLPTLPRGQYVMVSRLAYKTSPPSRGDVVVFRHPSQPGEDYIKRIVGLPGEHLRIEREKVVVNGTILVEPYVYRGASCDDDGRNGEWLPDEGEYFVIGDNRSDSQDSRSFGPIKREHLIGKVWLRYWPPSAWGVFHG